MDQPTGAKTFFRLLLALLLGNKPASELSREGLLTVVNSQTEGAKGPFSHAQRENLGSGFGDKVWHCVGAIFKKKASIAFHMKPPLAFYQQHYELWIKIGPPASELNKMKLQGCLRSVGSLAEIFGD